MGIHTSNERGGERRLGSFANQEVSNLSENLQRARDRVKMYQICSRGEREGKRIEV